MRESLSPRPRLVERTAGWAGRLLARVPGEWILRLLHEAPRRGDAGVLDPHLQALLFVHRLRGRPGLVRPSVELGRARLEREIAGATGRPTTVGAVRELVVDGAAGPLPARLYTPPAGGDLPPLLVWFHGGGFAIGSLETHDEPCRVICRDAGVVVLSVAYRLAPEHPFPAGSDDAVAATRWALGHVESLGADPARVAVGGDSAGASLAVGAAWAVAREGARLAGQLLVYPVTELEGTTESRRLYADGLALTQGDIADFEALYLPPGVDRTDERADLTRARDLALSPPTLLVTAGFDPLRDEGRRLGAALQAAGVPLRTLEYGSLVHGFLHLAPVVPGARVALHEVARAWREMMEAPAPAA